MTAIRSVGVVYHGLLADARGLAKALIERFGADGSWWMSTPESALEGLGRLSETDLIVTIGGDGTILRGVHVAAPRGLPVLGINMGRVGFMSEIDADVALSAMPWYLSGAARVERRHMIQAQIVNGAGPFHALNDVAVARGALVKVIDIAVDLNGARMCTYRADGLVTATATGSTGYCLALGGPVMDPESTDMLMKPVAAHRSLEGGLVLPADTVIEITVESAAEAVMSADGFEERDLAEGQVVRIAASPYQARFLRRKPVSAFYESLTRRLGMRQGALPRRPNASEPPDGV